MSEKIKQLMRTLVERNGSDLHLTGDSIPYFRIQGQIVPADSETLSEQQMHVELENLPVSYTHLTLPTS